MPDPSSTPNVPDELNLVPSEIDQPRMKRRSLSGKTGDDIRSTPSASPRPEPAARPVPLSAPHPNPASVPATPLYYTTGARKEDAPPMKTTSASASSSPQARPASQSQQARPVAAASAPQPAPQSRPAASASQPAPQSRPAAAASIPAPSSQPRPSAAASTASSPAPSAQQARPAAASGSASALSTSVATPGRATSVNDFRANVERQTREQKSVGGLISIVVYTLVGLFVLGGLLAGYGAYVLSKQIHQQSLTLADLDSRYTAQNQTLAAQMKSSNEALTEAIGRTQGQLSRQQDLLVHEQDALNKLITANEANTAAWRQERQSRAAETATLRNRIRDLEDQPRLR